MAGSVIGTPGFMSPEQLLGKDVDARSDIFSLGVTLYECATGRAAFDKGTPLEVSMRVVTDTPATPSAINPAVPSALDTIIARAMAKEPGARYASARALRTDLLALQQELAVTPSIPVAQAASSTTVPELSARFKTLLAVGGVAILAAWFFTFEPLRSSRHVPSPEAVVWYAARNQRHS